MKEKKSQSNQPKKILESSENTKIDLGLDLLDPTNETKAEAETMESRSNPFSSAKNSSSGDYKKSEADEILDDIERAEILLGEGLIDDAKKISRRILVKYNQHAKAQDILDKIFEIEKRQLLGLEQKVKAKDFYAADEEQTHEEEMSEFARIIGAEINFEQQAIKQKIFSSQDEIEKYKNRVLNAVLKLAPAARVDLGVAFLEMGFLTLAQAIFTSVTRYQDHKLNGTYLLGVALIEDKKYVQATFLLEPVINDFLVSEEDKIHFYYLMGVAFEKLKDKERSKKLFDKVLEINPKYRDIREKV